MEDPILASHLSTVRSNAAILLALAGVLAVSVISVLLRLPERIHRGESGQAAIQMLDAMRRPFLEIKRTEAGLLRTLDADAGNRELAMAVSSATKPLSRYEASARYSTGLSRNVAGLSQAFRDWVAVEGRVFSCVGVASTETMATPSGGCLVPGLALAADGFLTTMKELGAGEVSIHSDIADGRTASHMLQAAVAILLLYLTGLAFWAQRTMATKDAALLQEHLRAERDARVLETALSEALAKVLGGFISICANCKRVRVQENEWTPVEAYVTANTDARFSHGICPECMHRLYKDFLPDESGGQSA